jgi:hypothetical protein
MLRSSARSFVDGVDDLGVVDPAQVDRGNREVRVLDMRVMCEPCGAPTRRPVGGGGGIVALVPEGEELCDDVRVVSGPVVGGA